MATVVTTDLPDEVQSLSELIGIETTTQATLYVGVGTLTLLVYEYFITLDREIKYMWTGRKISTTSTLFFVNRYYPLVRAAVYIYYAFNLPIDPIPCIRLMDFNSYSTMLSVLTVEILMLLRAWALWNRRRAVGFFFIALCCGATIAAIITFRHRALYLPRVVPLPPQSVLPCYRPSPYKYVAAYSIGLVVESTSLVFMLGRAVWLGSEMKHDVPILKALKVQGVYYFVVVISTMIFTVFSAYFEKLACPVLFSGITPSITSLACTRVFLELRGLFLHSGAEIPPPYASGTSPSYSGHDYDGKDHLGGSRRRDHRNLSLDFFVSDTGGMTAQSTSAGTYEFTTFGQVGSGAGFPESPSNAL